MPFAVDKIAGNAMGGTEIMKNGLIERIDPELLDNFQIFVSRVHEDLSDKHVRILWLQDLAGDPASEHLKDGGWRNFAKLIFSSHWQMRGFIEMYNIPWSKCMVIHNAINPLNLVEKPKDKIKLIYTPTPHRGLDILYAVFNKLCEKHDNIELDVFSSFKLYGWEERDNPYTQLFESLEAHPKINYHGTQSNEVVRSALEQAHIFAYPSIWQETSCLCLMEAMSAGLACAHPNFGALPETASNWTFMYQWNEDKNSHAQMFYTVLDSIIGDIGTDTMNSRLKNQKAYMDVFYSWDSRIAQWEAFLKSHVDSPRELPKQMFSYKII